MIRFRCWYCGRRYAMPEKRVGENLVCGCERRLRVPRRNDGSSRARTLADWCVELTVYGGGGALLGFLLAVVILSRLRLVLPFRSGGGWLIVGCTLAGFLAGGLGGERGVNWVGRLIREREQS
jgi:hypothetical protein